MIKKSLAVAVILLFVGVAFAPSINANVSKASVDSELVEITVEISGIYGIKPHTVLLTQEDAEEVEKLIDDIDRRLDNVETREETVEIFNEAVVELDKYGLLGGLSIKQAKKVIYSKYLPQSRTANDDYVVNYFCLLYANYSSLPINVNLLWAIGQLFYVVDVFPLAIFHILKEILIPILFSYDRVRILNPFSSVILGGGSFYSIGLNGIVQDSGTTINLFGFSGIKIVYENPIHVLYLGCALGVNTVSGK